MAAKQNNLSTINRLTALWALGESGLGGWMHALKLPFTGIFVGGFAVLIIGLIAHYSNNSAKQILKATLLVLLVKAAVSPQSPLPAYVAVSFQGLIGALLFWLMPRIKLTPVLFGMIAMLESALQMVLMKTIVYGMAIWEALDMFFGKIVKELHLSANISFSLWIICLYCGGYALWGLILGIWINRLPKQLDQRTTEIQQQAAELKNTGGDLTVSKKQKRNTRMIVAFSILLFIVGVFLMSGSSMSKALYIIIRTVAVLLLIYYIIVPITKWLLQKFIDKQQEKNRAEMQGLIDQLPELRSYLRPAYVMASTKYKGLKRYREFVFILLALSLQTVHTEHE
jgi:cell division protein FtsL